LSPESNVAAGAVTQVRLFVAISLPEEVRWELDKVQGELKTLLPRLAATWTKPAGMHLTLRFLGNVPFERVPELSQRLSVALAGFGGLDLICERLGCFPDLRYPRVMWAGIHDEASRLILLFHRIDEAVSAFAEKPAEQRFTGHVTLARLKQISRPDAGRLARFVEGAAQRQYGRWTAKAVALIQSNLSQTGATYTELGCAALA
jgi:2'-5' RNA ligase